MDEGAAVAARAVVLPVEGMGPRRGVGGLDGADVDPDGPEGLKR
jgi:hypothetical protein